MCECLHRTWVALSYGAMNTRRSALLGMATAVTALLSQGARRAGAAGPVNRTLLAETEPAAKAIGYIANAAKVDSAAYPGYRRGQSCITCDFVELTSARQRGCTLVPDRLVMAAGWCKLWKLRGSA